MLTYSIDGAVPSTLYEQLYRCIKNDILSGVIASGDKLPSKRSLAKNLCISTITVEHAYGMLMEEGYIYSLPKKGYYAADVISRTEISRSCARFDAPLGAPSSQDLSSSLQDSEKDPRYFADFVSNGTNPDTFPFSTWVRLLRETIHDRRSELMIHSPSGGIRELREAICQYLYQFRGMKVTPEQVVVGAGTEYLYGLLIQLLGRSRRFAVENPGYRKIPMIYEKNGVSCSYIPLDAHGVRIDALTESGADILHISPSHHFPTGIITPVSRRHELLNWAAASEHRYIIEDDYDSEFRLGGRPLPTLQSIDTIEKVIYINTFTKSLSSTIRISYMILPPHLMRRFQKELGFYSCTVSNFEQYTLTRFLSEGYFEKHINRMRKYYRNQRNAILDCIKKHPSSADIQITEESAGPHFLIHFPSALSDEEIVRRAADAGIRISALSQYDHRTPAADARGTSGMHSAYDRYDRRDTRGASDTEDRDAEASAVHTLIVNYSGLRPEIIPEAADLLIRSIVIQRGDESITETQESLCRTPTGADSMSNSSADKTGFSAAENTLSDRPSKPSKGKHPIVGSLLLLLSGCISLFDFLSTGF